MSGQDFTDVATLVLLGGELTERRRRLRDVLRSDDRNTAAAIEHRVLTCLDQICDLRRTHVEGALAIVEECTEVYARLAYRFDPFSTSRKLRALDEVIDLIADLTASADCQDWETTSVLG